MYITYSRHVSLYESEKASVCGEFLGSTSVSIELVLLWLWMVEDVFQLVGFPHRDHQQQVGNENRVKP